MRCVRVTGSLVTVEMIARACAEVEARNPVTDRGNAVLLVVNDVEAGKVPVEVWMRVRERLISILDDQVAFQHVDLQPAPPRVTEPAPPEPVAQSGDRAVTLRVLVAQHDADFRAQLIACFADAGFDALGVADGAQALRQLAARPAHVIVADFELPKLAGDELLERARAAPSSPLRFAVLMGAKLPEVLVPPCEAADLVVGQPITPLELVERVRGALAARRHRAG